VKYGVQPLVKLRQRRNLVGNARVADLVLRADDALRERGRRCEKRAGDLLRREPADFAQRERDLRIGGERRVTTGEDESEAIVFDLLVISFRRWRHVRRESLRHLDELRVEPGAASHAIDGLEAPGGDEPGTRVRGDPLLRPALHGGCECVVERLFREIEVPEQPDECREYAAGFAAVDRVDCGAGVGGVSHARGA